MEPNVYLILGCATSGRRQVLYDLITDEATEDNPFTILREAGEERNEWDEKMAAHDHVTIETFETYVASIATDQLNPNHTNIILTPGKQNPVDQLEALPPLLEASDCGLSRIITVVHCGLLETHDHLQTWYDGCIHFSDVCLINRGPETSNQFVQDFLDRYKAKHIPCLFDQTKKGRIKNPGLILESEPRRMSLFFEPAEDAWLDDEDDEDEEGPVEDPYIEKLVSGQRKKKLPDIAAILDGE